MKLDEYIINNRMRITSRIHVLRKYVGHLSDQEIKQWIDTNEELRKWVKSEGVSM